MTWDAYGLLGAAQEWFGVMVLWDWTAIADEVEYEQMVVALAEVWIVMFRVW